MIRELGPDPVPLPRMAARAIKCSCGRILRTGALPATVIGSCLDCNAQRDPGDEDDHPKDAA